MRSGGVIKKKSSSGCLIIKKKADVLGSGVGSSRKEKKRPRVIACQSGSSDDSSEPVRRKFNDRRQNGAIVYGRRVEEFRRNGEVGESERKRNRMDLFEFDEYDEFDGKKMRNDFMGMAGRSGNSGEFVSGSSRSAMVEKRKQAYYDGSSSGLSGRNKKAVPHGAKGRFDLEEDEAHLPISLLRLKYQEESAEPIRLQGKNGVLKVMVNKKKKMDLSSRTSHDRQAVDINRKGSSSEEAVKEETPVRPSYQSDTKRAEKRIAFNEKEISQAKLQKQMLGKPNKAGDCEREKGDCKLQKQLVGKSNKAGEYESDGTDTSLKLAPPTSEAAGGATKAVKTETQRSLPSENVTPIKGGERNVTVQADKSTPAKVKDGKLKRGGSTEKQLLREMIRGMLIQSGWTIDYRPRRNRDYLDAVYINPSGTAYWSIIKAYDALQKQDNEKNEADGSSFTRLSDDVLSKLTRHTRKKREEERKKKRRDVAASKNTKKSLAKDPVEDSDSDNHEEKLSSFIRQNGKSKKGRLPESNCEGGDDLSDDSSGPNPEQDKAVRPFKSKSNVVQARKTRKIGRCTLLVRNSDKGPNSESDGYVPYTGKRTLLAWLIDSGTVQSSEKVQYMNRRRTRVKLEGWITRDGIHCGCCSKILTVSKFELHAGSKLRQPFQNITLESGPSLLQCLIDAWNKQEEFLRQDFHVVDVDSDDPDDDTCGICGDGGDLICCDSCPSTFHKNCLGIQVPKVLYVSDQFKRIYSGCSLHFNSV